MIFALLFLFISSPPVQAAPVYSVAAALAAPKADDARLDAAWGELAFEGGESLYEGEASLNFARLMTKIRSWRKPTRSREGKDAFQYCARQIREFQCANSEFSRLTLLERYDEITKIVNARLKTRPDLEEYRHTVPCLMSRETETLDPLSVSYFNCYPGRFASDQGLGQVTLATFLWALGLNEREVDLTIETYVQKVSFKNKKKARAKRMRLLSDSRAAKLPVITDVYPFNTHEYRKNPIRIYEEMSGNPQFQIDLVLRVLDLKRARGVTIEDTLVNYNGSKTKVEYGRTVMACKSCLDLGADNVAYCLGLAQGRELSRDVKDVTVCP